MIQSKRLWKIYNLENKIYSVEKRADVTETVKAPKEDPNLQAATEKDRSDKYEENNYKQIYRIHGNKAFIGVTSLSEPLV